MEPQPRLREIVQWGSVQDLRAGLGGIVSALSDSCSWIQSNVKRDEKSNALCNFLKAACRYVSLAEQHIEGPIEVIALCARGAYELDLRLIHVLQSEEHLHTWVAEMALDRIEVFEGTLGLSPSQETDDAAQLRAEIQRLKAVLTKQQKAVLHDQQAKRSRTSDLAKAAGREVEHQAFFKLMSKLVHPSSYIVNWRNQSDIHGWQNRDILLVHLQLWTLEMLECVRRVVDMPNEVLAALGPIRGLDPDRIPT